MIGSNRDFVPKFRFERISAQQPQENYAFEPDEIRCVERLWRGPCTALHVKVQIHDREVSRTAARSDVIDLRGDDVTTASLISMARLNNARSQIRPSTSIFIRIDQTC
jgi:hypothetical protein